MLRLTNQRIRKSLASAGFMLPALVALVLCFDLPVFRMFSLSFESGEGLFAPYAELLSTSAYLLVLLNTFKIALLTAIACGVLGYVCSYWIFTMPARWRLVCLALIGLSFWISILVRTYAWIVVLGNNGIVNRTLLDLGLIKASLPLIYNGLGVCIGTVNLLLPIVILPVYATMLRFDDRLRSAARSLGASNFTVFWRVFFPLTLPALLASCVLVFVLTLGFLITPAILGGNRVPMIATLLDSLINVLSDWQLASALSVLLLSITLVLYVVQRSLAATEQQHGARA